jgi:hypothetical protein
MRQRLRWLTALCMGVTFIPSCGHDQQLVSVTVQPTTETFGSANIPVSADAGATVQLRALGSYIHPPVTKDITNKVQWTSNTPDMVTVNSTGLITVTGLACGNTLVSATVTTNSSAGNIASSGAIVTGSMTANVVCFAAGGTGSNPTLSVNFNGIGSGTIASSPVGLACASTAPTCSTTAFTTGTPVQLTATPNSGSTFGNWLGCDSTSGQVCNVNLTTSRSVTVTFN